MLLLTRESLFAMKDEVWITVLMCNMIGGWRGKAEEKIYEEPIETIRKKEYHG